MYGDDCMSYTQVYTWFTRFRNGRDQRPSCAKASNRAVLLEMLREITQLLIYNFH